MCAAILFSPAASGQDGDLLIDAREITGLAETEVLARDAELRYGEYYLRAGRMRYDTQAGWVKASEGVVLEDQAGHRLSMDLLDYFPLLARAVAEGNVHLESEDGLLVWADLLRYEIDRQGLYLENNVVLEDDRGNRLASSRLSYLLDERTGEAHDVLISSDRNAGVIKARRAQLTSSGGYQLDDASYTTCKIDDPAWLLQADSIAVDSDDVVVATNTKLEFFGVPVMYLPRLSFINSDERRSGFLVPRLLFRSGGEVNVEVPYYLNLAPNYDAVVKARFINGTGVYGGVDGRWLFRNASGEISLAGIRDEQLEDSRGHYSVDSRMEFGDDVHLDVVADWISDDEFADDFFDGDATARRHYEQRIELYRSVGDWQFGGRLLHHRTIRDEDDGVERPYDSLPGAWAYWAGGSGAVRADVDLQLDFFQRRSDDPLNGYRVSADSSAGRHFRFGRLDAEFEAGAAAAVYEYEDRSWVTPYTSVQLRQPFRGDWSFGERRFHQLLEPRLFVGAVRATDYDGVPVYDTKRTEFNASDIYQINTFVGGDRVEDSGVVVYGLDTHLWSRDSSQRLFSGRVAQRYRIEDSKISLADEPPPTAGGSNIIAEGTLHASQRNRYKGRLEWDPELSQFEQVDLAYQHLSDLGHSYEMRYARINQPGAEEDDGEASLGIYRILTGNWRFVGDFSYDLDDSQVTKVDSGVKFESSCRCWGADFFIEHEPLATNDRTTYYLQVNLMGLGSSGGSRFEDVVSKIKEPL